MVNFTKNNPSLAPLFTVSYPTDYFNLKNSKLPRSLKIEGAVLYEALFGAPQDPEDFTLVLKSQDGELQKIYSPSVGKSPDSDTLAIKWGEKYTNLELSGANIIPRELPSGLKFESITISEADFGYQNKETALVIVLECDEGYYDLELPLRFIDIQGAPKYAEFKTMLKKNASKALSLLHEVTEGSGGSGASINKLTDLPEGSSVVIVDYENYVFTTKKNEEMARVLLVDDKGTKYWCPDTLDKVVHLYEVPLTMVLETFKKSTSGNSFIETAHVYNSNEELVLTIGSSTRAVPEKELPVGKYTLWGIDSFTVNSNGKNFLSYVYTIQDESGKVLKSFAPSKHRTILNSDPIIDADNPGEFEVYVSGKENPKDFMVSQLKATFTIDEDSVDLDSLF